MLASASLAQSEITIAGGFNNQWWKHPIGFSILDEDGNDVSKRVTVLIKSPDRVVPLEANAKHLLDVAAIRGKTDAYYGAADVLYDVDERSVIVGRVALQGAYEITVIPNQDSLRGQPITVPLTVLREPECVVGAMQSAGFSNLLG